MNNISTEIFSTNISSTNISNININKKQKRLQAKINRKLKKQKILINQENNKNTTTIDTVSTQINGFERKQSSGTRRRSGYVDSEVLKETTYYFDEQYRYVIPYYYTWYTNIKRRWCGQSIGHIFEQEFKYEYTNFVS